MALRNIVAKNLRDFRVKSGLTQEELSKRSRVNIRHLSQMENQNLNLTLDTLERLAKGLGISPAELLKDAEKVNPIASKRELAGVDAALRLLRGYRNQIDTDAK